MLQNLSRDELERVSDFLGSKVWETVLQARREQTRDLLESADTEKETDQVRGRLLELQNFRALRERVRDAIKETTP